MSNNTGKVPFYLCLLLALILIGTNVGLLKLYMEERNTNIQLRQQLEEQSQSIGILAGQAVVDFKKKTMNSYQQVQEKTDEALEELRKTGEQMLQTMNVRMEGAREEMEKTAHAMLVTFQEELAKFEETLRESDANVSQSQNGS